MVDIDEGEPAVTSENNVIWKEVDPSRPWVVFDMEETLLIIMNITEKDKAQVQNSINFFNSEDIKNWISVDGTNLVILRPGVFETLSDLGRDCNIALLSSASGTVVDSVIKANPDFAKLFCFASGSEGIDNDYYGRTIPTPPGYDQPFDMGINFEAKHPSRIISERPKVLVDDTENELWIEGNPWQFKNVGFVRVQRASPPLKDDRELFKVAGEVRKKISDISGRI